MKINVIFCGKATTVRIDSNLRYVLGAWYGDDDEALKADIKQYCGSVPSSCSSASERVKSHLYGVIAAWVKEGIRSAPLDDPFCLRGSAGEKPRTDPRQGDIFNAAEAQTS